MHKPVLLNEVLEYLNPQTGGVFIDATINGGGHSQAIAERIGKSGKLLGIDRDCELVEHLNVSGFRFQVSGFKLVCSTFANIRQIAQEHNFTNADGIVFDLGFSSFHIEEAGRGFSFQRDEPLDMRYNRQEGSPASEIVNTYTQEELQALLFTLGEERYARRIARSITRERERSPLRRTGDLVEAIRKAVPPPYRRGRIHFATRTFQALRMRVNDELEHIAKGIKDACACLKPGGRIAVISFHSGEDRIVKTLFRELERESSIKRITKRVARATKEECNANPRARPAKLRVAEKISNQ